MEQRWGTRMELDVLAEMVASDGSSAMIRVKDASVSGAFVVTKRRLSAFSRVALCPAGQGGAWLDGWVVRAEADGYGVEWLDPGLQAVSMLLSLRPECEIAAMKPLPRPRESETVSWKLLERLYS
jgi:hypothetical protein